MEAHPAHTFSVSHFIQWTKMCLTLHLLHWWSHGLENVSGYFFVIEIVSFPYIEFGTNQVYTYLYTWNLDSLWNILVKRWNKNITYENIVIHFCDITFIAFLIFQCPSKLSYFMRCYKDIRKKVMIITFD